MNVKDFLLIKGLNENQINDLIQTKKKELDVTDDEALRLIGAEMRILQQKEVKIKDLQLGLKHITLKGTIERILDIKAGNNYKMRKIIVSDETGKVAVILWNEGAIKASENMVEGDEINVINGYVRFNSINKALEVHVGKEGTIVASQKLNKTLIKNLQDGYNLIEGFIVRSLGYKVIKRCAICKTKVEDRCPIHGNIAIESHVLAKFIIDDGTGSIRVAAFDKIASKLLELSKEQSNEAKLDDLANNLTEIKAYVLKKGDKYKIKRIYPINFNST